MLSEEQKSVFKYRIELVISNVRCCNSSCDVHEVGNIRNVAFFLEDFINDKDATEECVSPMLKRLENKCTDFFKKKYSKFN